ncbi:MAG: hypothetical protein A3H44_08770 [Gammaproteobacteria bacterium RIFCSPLOWO2_02_FULL_57_10]|nr:MAG: hypothetical protein A3H44_08770 [Gammaproteobacteria bacterium RIFCSPLOWO2_02_FULL_57_10]
MKTSLDSDIAGCRVDLRVFELSEAGSEQVRELFAQRLSDNPRSAELMARRPQWQSEPRSD